MTKSVRQNKRVVLVDIDEVLFPFAQAYARWLAANSSLTINVDKLRAYDVPRAVGPQHLELVCQFLSDPAVLLLETPIVEGAEAVCRLADTSRLIACTSRRQRYEGQSTEAWLSRHLPVIDDVIFTRAWWSGVATTKSYFAHKLGARALIDDTGVNLYGLPIGCRGLLMRRPVGLMSEEGAQGWPSVLRQLGLGC